MRALTGESPWRLSWRADPAARAVADRHYNRQTPGADGFVPPGRCLVLKTIEVNPATREPWAVWVTSWPFEQYVLHRWAGAWVNSLFRREGGPGPSSDLIRWAVAHTRAYWPAIPARGLITFVDPGEVESADGGVIGYCYRRAGFRHVGETVDDKLWAFHLEPRRMPPPVPAPGTQLTLDEAWPA